MTRHYRALLGAGFLCIGCSAPKPDDQPADGGDSPSCKLAVPPSRPPAAGDPGSIEFVVVVRNHDLGDSDDDSGNPKSLAIGFDLDGVCTGHGDGPSCSAPNRVTEQGADGPGGRDNAQGGRLAEQARHGLIKPTKLADSLVATGMLAGAFRVREYNGSPNDPQVSIAFYSVNRHLAPELGPPEPTWRGDVWRVFEPWLAEGGTADDPNSPRYYDDRAYVTDGVLVAHFDSVKVGHIYSLSKAMMTASVVPNGDHWSFRDGIFAGRIKSENVLADLETSRVCTTSPTYPDLKKFICDHGDINLEGFDDGSGPCNAWSWGWNFNADPAEISGVVPASLSPNCEPGQSPASDPCER